MQKNIIPRSFYIFTDFCNLAFLKYNIYAQNMDQAIKQLIEEHYQLIEKRCSPNLKYKKWIKYCGERRYIIKICIEGRVDADAWICTRI